jgi:hypothetical protein
MGPVNMEWIRQNGEGWSMGRIDCSGTGLGPYGDELGVPPMKSEDWRRFGDWLWDFSTDALWTLDMLVAEYEKNNPKITWLKNELYD